MHQLEPIENAISELCISSKELLEALVKLQINIVIEPQEEIEIYITNPTSINSLRPFFERITEDGALLCIGAQELSRGNFISEFSHICYFTESQYGIYSPALWQLKKSHKELARKNSGSFSAAARDALTLANAQTLQSHNNTFNLIFATFKSSKHNTTTEPSNTRKPINLEKTKKYLRKSDIELIKIALRENQPKCGIFIPGNWTSSALTILNEASTYFFSEDHDRTKRLTENERDAIEEWLIKKWADKGLSHAGDLAEEARKIITPSKISLIHTEREIFDSYTLSQYNPYDSNSLIAVNETAKKFYNKRAKTDRADIINDLNSIYQLKLRTARMAATIIIKR